jgi:hypothetical protein
LEKSFRSEKEIVLTMRHLTFPILWTLFILLLCGLPGNTFPDLSFWKLLSFDSLAHAFVFAVFVFLWSVGLTKLQNLSCRKKPIRFKKPYRFALFAGIFYGILIEVLQYYVFIGRDFEVSDIISDTIGCFTGLAIFIYIYRSELKISG